MFWLPVTGWNLLKTLAQKSLSEWLLAFLIGSKLLFYILQSKNVFKNLMEFAFNMNFAE